VTALLGIHGIGVSLLYDSKKLLLFISYYFITNYCYKLEKAVSVIPMGLKCETRYNGCCQ
jgi:hypothetical protein